MRQRLEDEQQQYEHHEAAIISEYHTMESPLVKEEWAFWADLHESLSKVMRTS